MKNQCNENGISSGRFSTACREKLHDLKERVTASLASEFGGLLNLNAVRQVVNDADALAAITPYPFLLLPTLAQEKAQVALEWENRQRLIRSRSMAFAE